MFCTKCGNQNSDDSRFCGCCGAVLNHSAVVYAEEQVPEIAEIPMAEPTEMQSLISEQVSEEKPKKGKKKLILGILIPIVAVLLIAGITVGAVVAPYYGPMRSIVKAVEKTVNAESFYFKIKAKDVESDGAIDGKGSVILDFDKKDIMMYIRLTESGTHYDYDYDYYSYYGEYKEVEYVDEEFFGIYDGKYFEGDAETGEVDYVEDISEVIETCFESYGESDEYMNSKGFDWDKLFDKISEETDYDIDRDDVEEYVNLDTLNDSLKTAWKSLNNKTWLEENLNYEKERSNGVTYYSFKPDYKALANSAEEIFSEAIVDDDLQDSFEYVLDELVDDAKEDDDFDIKTTIGIKKGYLHEITFKNGYTKAEIEFGNIGSATLDEKQLQEYIDSAD